MHIIGSLQDEETVINKKFDGDVSDNDQRTLLEIQDEYFRCFPSMIDEIFTGIQRSVVKCAACNHESVTIKPYSCLSLPLESSLKKSLNKNFEVS